MTAQFAEIWEQLGKIDNFVIVEQGAHDGQFARDVLQSARLHAPEFFEALDYRIIEPFPILRERQSQMLEPFRNKIEWRDSLEPFTGVHFSNELLDAMPVRLISRGMEKLVDLQDDIFVFIERPLSNMAFNQAALDWIDNLAANLKRGTRSPSTTDIRAMNFRETFRSAPSIEISTRPLNKSVTRTLRCTSIGQALPVAPKQKDSHRRIHRSASFPYRHHLQLNLAIGINRP